MKKSFLFFVSVCQVIIFVLIAFSISAQYAVWGDTILPDGKKYSVYPVKKGETLYSIAKQFQVDVKNLVALNPTAMNALQPGQKLLIPFRQHQETPKETIREGNYILHTVQQGQTLYSIAKKYAVSIEEIRILNPDLESGLKAGIMLKIPSAEPEADSDTLFVTEETVRADSAGIKPVFKNLYRMAFILPFYLHVHDTMQHREDPNIPPQVYNRSNPALHFYEGALLALDSMKKIGMDISTYWFDSANDTAVVKEILRANDSLLRQCDVIIGPFHGKEFSMIADFAKSHSIKLVSATLARNDILVENPNIFKIRPSIASQLEHLANFIVRNCASKPIVILYNQSETEKKRAAGFRSFLGLASKKRQDDIAVIPGEKENANKLVTQELLVKELVVKKTSEMNIAPFLSVSDTTVVVIPSSDQVFVSEVIPVLNETARTYAMMVTGMAEWESYENIETDYLMNLHVHLPLQHDIDPDSEEYQYLRKLFFSRYKTHPDDFALSGFDITRMCVALLQTYGTAFELFLDKKPVDGVYSKYLFKQLGQGNGWENNYVCIKKYHDYRIVKVYPVE